MDEFHWLSASAQACTGRIDDARGAIGVRLYGRRWQELSLRP